MLQVLLYLVLIAGVAVYDEPVSSSLLQLFIIKFCRSVLNRLSQAYFELALAYVDAPAEKETSFEAGKDAALAALYLEPAVVAAREKNGFRAALRATSNVASIFWYGNNLGQWLNYHQLTAIMGGVRSDQTSDFVFFGLPRPSLSRSQFRPSARPSGWQLAQESHRPEQNCASWKALSPRLAGVSAARGPMATVVPGLSNPLRKTTSPLKYCAIATRPPGPTATPRGPLPGSPIQ